MDKLKSIVGRKSTDSPAERQAGEASHLGTSSTASERHPIYDEFTTRGSDPAASSTLGSSTAGTAPTTSGVSHDRSTTSPTSAFGSGTSTGPSTGAGDHLSRPGPPTEGLSNTGIKSGVLGFPEETHDTHASLGVHPTAEQSVDGSQIGSHAGSPSTIGQRTGDSHLGRDAALGAGAGGLAAHELGKHHGQTTETSRTADQQPYERSLEPATTHGADRAFPLAGGVTSSRSTEPHAATQTTSSAPIQDKSPGFLPAQHRETTGADVGGLSTHRPNETFASRDVGPTTSQHETARDNHGREALAGAAAAATASSAVAHHEHKDKDLQGTGTHHPDALAASTASQSRSHDPLTAGSTTTGLTTGGPNTAGQSTTGTTPAGLTSTGPTTTGTTASHSHHPDALAAATAGVAAKREERDIASHSEDKHASEGRSGGLFGAITSKFRRDPKDEEPTTTGSTATSSSHHPTALAAATAGHPRSETTRETPAEMQKSTAGTSHNPEALAAATAAAHKYGRTESHTHGGRGHNYTGDPCSDGTTKTAEDPSTTLLYTKGPHQTDAANAFDPKVHVPGGFPSPTPTHEAREPVYPQASHGVASSGSGVDGSHELRHTGTLPSSQTTATEPHHHGRDAAVAGGLGAAGVGAYEAAKHHEHQPSSTTGQTSAATGQPSTTTGQSLPIREANPYSSHAVDPRIHGRTAGTAGHSTQPTIPEKHPEHAALAGGAAGLGAAGLAAHQGTRSHDGQENVAPGTTSGQTSQQATAPSDGSHHTGRDAALAAAGATTTAGLYERQRANEPASGPASSTVGPHKSNVLNVLDPRVQPDPSVQKHHHAAPTVEDPAPSTVGHHKSDLANVMDPRVLPDPQKQKAASRPEGTSEASRPSEHHLGRDAAIAGGLGATGAGAYAAGHGHRETASTGTSGQYPVQSGPTSGTSQYSSSQPSQAPLNTSTAQQGAPERREHDHHLGRDAAAVGGLGAAGAGTYAATHGQHANQPSAGHSMSPPTQTGEQPIGSAAQYPLQSGPTSTTASQDPSSVHSAGQNAPAQSQVSGHHYGRDAAVAGGLGAAGAGTYAATHHGQEHPAVLPHHQPSTQVAGQPSIPETKHEHHYGRDAAAAGGLGAAGAGTYAATHHKHDQQPLAQSQQHSTQLPGQTSSVHESKHDHHYGRDAAAVGGLGAAGAGTYAASHHKHDQQPLAQSSQQQSNQIPGPTSSIPEGKHDHHYGRDAAAVGGLGAAGAGTYAATHHKHDQQPLAQSSQQPLSSQAYPQTTTATQPHSDSHHGRDAAAVGGAGLAGAAGAHELSKHDYEKQQKKELKEHEKAEHAQHKAAEKEAKQEEKHHNKLVAAEEKKHDKLLAKEEKQHHKELEREEKEEEGEGKKKRGLLGFLHRKKDNKDSTGSGESSPRQSRDDPRHSREYAAAGATAAGGAAAYEAHHHEGHDHDGKHERHRLHKDPPPGHPAREALEHPEQYGQAGTHQHFGTDGAIGSSALHSSTHPTTAAGGPSSGLAGSGTDQRVIEPHTGLPMNIGKYGDSAGGTDGNPVLAAHHHGATGGTSTGLTGAGMGSGPTGTSTGTTGLREAERRL